LGHYLYCEDDELWKFGSGDASDVLGRLHSDLKSGLFQDEGTIHRLRLTGNHLQIIEDYLAERRLPALKKRYYSHRKRYDEGGPAADLHAFLVDSGFGYLRLVALIAKALKDVAPDEYVWFEAET